MFKSGLNSLLISPIAFSASLMIAGGVEANQIPSSSRSTTDTLTQIAQCNWMTQQTP
ncbi:MAG: hypothetical protein HC866_24010 [Leptolyngbyaceae cyanobacterium RU_5_1]|nr:hypothetical protein [Leptolyngbyaceae cyanobacterium RU_5_1]